MQAVWKGELIAEAANSEVVEGNDYFPAMPVTIKFIGPSDTRTTNTWKGEAGYYSL